MSTMAEIFQTDPLKLKREDIDAMVLEYRANRGKFQLGNMTAGKTAKKPTEKQAQASKAAGKLDLSKLL